MLDLVVLPAPAAAGLQVLRLDYSFTNLPVNEGWSLLTINTAIMDSHDLPTSPRKKLKTYHDPQPMMADAMVYEMPSKMQSSTVDGQPPMKASSGEDRLDKEVQCGITEYVSPHLPGFQGILKKRYTDFLVNEILPSGQVIHLDNVKKPADRQQQSSSSAQAPSAHKQDGRAKENTPPRFESTNLNKVEQGPRKKEIVYMQHGADTLNLVDKQDIPGLAASKATATAEHNPEVPHNEAPEAPRTGGRGVAGSVPATAEDTGDRSSLEVTAATNGQADYAGPPHPRQSGHESAVGGWQAYAESNTGTTKLTVSLPDFRLTYLASQSALAIEAAANRPCSCPMRTKASSTRTSMPKPWSRSLLSSAGYLHRLREKPEISALSQRIPSTEIFAHRSIKSYAECSYRGWTVRQTIPGPWSSALPTRLQAGAQGTTLGATPGEMIGTSHSSRMANSVGPSSVVTTCTSPSTRRTETRWKLFPIWLGS